MTWKCRNLIAIALALSLTVYVGYILALTMKESLDELPKGEFVVAKKEVRQVRYWLFFTAPMYVFYYNESHWVEVTEEDYSKYEVGDTYPNDYVILHQI